MTTRHADGKRLLVVEDDSLIALMMQDMLEELGHRVAGVAANIDQALDMAQVLDFDAAILDLSLNGRPSFPVAEVLQDGGVPFFFATGFNGQPLPERFGGVAVIGKPFAIDDLVLAIRATL